MYYFLANSFWAKKKNVSGKTGEKYPWMHGHELKMYQNSQKGQMLLQI